LNYVYYFCILRTSSITLFRRMRTYVYVIDRIVLCCMHAYVRAKNAKNAKSYFAFFLHFFILFLPHDPNETTILCLPRLRQNPYKNKNKYETMKILFQREQKKQRSQPYHENLNTPFLLFLLPLLRTIKFKNSKMQKIHALKHTRNFRILGTFPSPASRA